MLPLGILLTWAGYGLTSWGWVLVQGYNITARQWFSPLHPYQWPAQGATIPRVPKGHLFPTSGTTGTTGTAKGGPPAAVA